MSSTAGKLSKTQLESLYQTGTPQTTPAAPAPAQNQPAPGLTKRIWDGTKSVLWSPITAIQWTYNATPITSVKEAYNSTVNLPTAMGDKLKDTLDEVIWKQAPTEMYLLRADLKKTLMSSSKLTNADLKRIVSHLHQLLDNNGELLRKLAPNLNRDGIEIVEDAYNFLLEFIPDDTAMEPNQDIETLKKQIQNNDDVAIQHVGNMLSLLDDIIVKNEGNFAKFKSSMTEALANESVDLLELIKSQATHPDTGVIKTLVDSFMSRVKAQDGPVDYLHSQVDLLSTKLDKTKTQLLADAAEFLERKFLGKAAVKDANDVVLTPAEEGLLQAAGKVLKEQSHALLAEGMIYLKNETTSDTGLIALVKKKLTQDEDSVLKSMVKLVDEYLFLDGTGAIPKLKKELTDEHAGILAKGLEIISKKFLDEREGILAKGMEYLQTKFFSPGGLVEQFEDRLTNENTGLLVKAFNKAGQLVQEKLNGIVDQLDTKVNGEAHPTLRKVRAKTVELQRAVQARNTNERIKIGKDLELAITRLEANEVDVFTKLPLSADDKAKIAEFKAALPAIYSKNPPLKAEILRKIEAVLLVINRYYSIHEGMIARVGTVFQDQLADTMHTVTSEAKKIVAALNGTPETTETEEEESADGTATNFFESSKKFLGNLLERGGKEVSKTALTTWAKVMVFGIERVLKHMGGTPALDQAKAALNGLKDTLNAEMKNDDDDLSVRLHSAYDNFWKFFNTMNQEVRIYLNGFRIPRFGSSHVQMQNADGLFLNNINKLRDAQEDPAIQIQNANWKKEADDEKDKLVANTTLFQSLKFIYEKVCGLTSTDDNFYYGIMKKGFNLMLEKKGNIISTTPEEKENDFKNASNEIKKLFFEKLAEKKVHPLRMLLVKISFFLLSKIVHHYVGKAATIYFEEIFRYIEKYKHEEFDSLRNLVVNNFTRYLTILGGAYSRVAKNDNPTGKLDEMLKTELEKPEANLNHRTEELYRSFAENVLKKATGSRLITWVAKFFIGDPKTLVRSTVDNMLNGVQGTRGFTHALNTVIREQLDEIWGMLKTDTEKQEEGTIPKSISELSEVKRTQLTELVKNLFEILHKSKCLTRDELHKLIKGELASANINGAVDDLFIQDVIEKITNILAITIQTLVNKDQLLKLTSKFAKLANRTYEEGAPVDLETMKKEERNIAERCEDILRLSINNAVNEKFDFTGAKQQKETNRRIEELRKRTTTFVTDVQEVLGGMSATVDFSSADGKSKIETLYAATEAFNSQCFEASSKSKAARINSDNKSAVNKNYHGVGQQAQLLTETVAQIKRHAMTIDLLKKVGPECSALQLILDAIKVKLFLPTGPSAEAQEFCEKQILALEQHLSNMKKMTLQVKGCGQEQLNAFCLANSQENSLFEQTVRARRLQNDPKELTTELKQQFATLRREITSFNTAGNIDENDYCSKLLNELKKIEAATDINEIEIAHQEYLKLVRYGHLFLLIDRVDKGRKVLALVLTDVKIALKVKAFCATQVQPNSLLENIVIAKKRNPHLSNLDPAFTKKMDELKTAIKLSCDPSLMPILLRQCKKIEDSKQIAQVELAYQEFLTLLRQAQTQAVTSFNDLTRKYEESAREIREAIHSAPLLNSDQAVTMNENIHLLISIAQDQVKSLDDWKNANVKDEPYTNLSIVDLKWAKDWAGGLVYDRVRERLDGLIAFLKREETWRFGLLNHLFLIPYTEATMAQEKASS